MTEGRTLDIQTPRAFKPLLVPARYKAAYGGRSSGKSHFFAESVIERCVRGPSRIVCIREVQNSLKDSVRQLMIDKIEAMGISPYFDTLRDEVRVPATKSLVTFRGMNEMNSENIKSLEGFDVAWVEEAQTMSRRSLNLLRPTIRKEASELWFSWNPRYKTDPVDEFFRKNPPKGALIVKVNWEDNPWFPPALKAEIERDYAVDAEMAAHVWGGAYEPAPEGSYYGPELQKADAEGRITDIMIDPALPVHTAWDLGVGRNMTTWLFQAQMGQFKWVDFIEYDVAGLPYAVSELKKKQQERNFVWGTHLWPHDGSATDTGSGERRSDTMMQLGFPVEVLERTKNLGDGIEATRRMLQTSWFDRDRCATGLEHLRGYRRKFDKARERFLDEPDKNGHDHGADALRCAAQGREKLTNGVLMAEMPKEVMNWTYRHGA